MKHTTFEQFLPGLTWQQFESASKSMLLKTPEYQQEIADVWLWKDWPGRWGADCGIDLIALTTDGKTIAIQCKLYDDKYWITKSDVDSFLSESNRVEIDSRMLIASTDHIGFNAINTINGQEKPVTLLLRSDLSKLSVDWTPDEIEPLAPFTPRPDQEEALEAILRGFETHDRGQLIKACRTGKTYDGQRTAIALGAENVIIFVHSLDMMKQTFKAWKRNGDFDYLGVCSDETFDADDNDIAVSKISELGLLHVTTTPSKIAQFLDTPSEKMKVVFCTYQSSPQIAKAQKISETIFDLAISDEAHLTTGWNGKVFSTVLDNTKIKANKRLFMTATPRNGKGGNSMDNESLYGPVFYFMSFARANALGLICDYRVIVMGFDSEKYKEMADSGRYVNVDGELITDARTLATQIGLMKTMEKYGLSRSLTFHNRVKNAMAFSKSFPMVCDIPGLVSRYISGVMTTDKRNTIALELVEHDGIISVANCRCWNTGYDIPSLDIITFADPKYSKIDMIQSGSRVMTNAEGKEMGYIFIPVMLERGEDAEAVIEKSVFDSLYQVIQALREHDEVFADQLDEFRKELGRWPMGKPPVLPKFIFEIEPEWLDKADFTDKLTVQIIKRTTSDWFEMFGEFLNVGNVKPTFKTENGVQIGQWERNQRNPLRSHLLSGAQRDLLTENGFIFDVVDAKWQTVVDEATAYLATNPASSNGFIPTEYKTPDGYWLGAWASLQRRKRDELTQEHFDQLDAIPGWLWETPAYGHGTGVMYGKGCRCEECRISKNEYGKARYYANLEENRKRGRENVARRKAVKRRELVVA